MRGKEREDPPPSPTSLEGVTCVDLVGVFPSRRWDVERSFMRQLAVISTWLSEN